MDRALFLGDRSETADHAHNAVEISIALDDAGIDVTTSQDNVRGAAGALVRADARHALSIPGPKVAVLYVEPLSAAGVALTQVLGDRHVQPLPSVARHQRRLRELLSALSISAADAQTIVASVIAELAPVPKRPRIDRRIREAIELLRTRLDDPPSQAELATQVGMSASWFGHQFSRHVGVPMRRYLLWLRLRAALVSALKGASMTHAAHDAGFADAAHFSRTCHKMFGLAPTAFAPVDAVFVIDGFA